MSANGCHQLVSWDIIPFPVCFCCPLWWEWCCPFFYTKLCARKYEITEAWNIHRHIYQTSILTHSTLFDLQSARMSGSNLSTRSILNPLSLNKEGKFWNNKSMKLRIQDFVFILRNRNETGFSKIEILMLFQISDLVGSWEIFSKISISSDRT